MPRRAILAVFLVVIVVAIRCVPGRVGIIDVRQVVPPMPLKTTPEGSGHFPSATPSVIETPRATPTPTPTPFDNPYPNPEPIVEPVPGRTAASARSGELVPDHSRRGG